MRGKRAGVVLLSIVGTSVGVLLALRWRDPNRASLPEVSGHAETHATEESVLRPGGRPSPLPQPGLPQRGPGTVVVLLPVGEAAQQVLTVVARPAGVGTAPPVLAENIDGIATLSLAAGAYEVSWQVAHRGDYVEKVNVAAGERVVIDGRNVALSRLRIPEHRARLVVNVVGTDGVPISGVTVQASDRESVARASRTDERGNCTLLVRSGAVSLMCGMFAEDLTVPDGEDYAINIPGNRAATYGELVVFPAATRVQIRERTPEGRWLGTDLVDPADGRRFPLVRAGVYEIGRTNGDAVDVLRSVEVRGATRAVVRLDTAVLLLKPRSTSASLPRFLQFDLTGTGPGASHPDGYRFLWATPDREATIPIEELRPGAYRIRCLDAAFRFTTEVEVASGESRTVVIELGAPTEK